MPHANAFVEIAAILGLATLTGMIGQKLRQPLIIMFLATGILAGPSFLGIIHSYEQIELLAHIGIALLLFIVGLKLDLTLIRTTGPVALATGLGQILFTSLIGFLIALALGMAWLNAAYVAVALTFSSTIIIVKLLSDKKEIDSLHGQIALGFLIVQDIAAILALVGLTTLGTASASGNGASLLQVLLIAAKGLGLLGATALLMKFVIPQLAGRLAHSIELLSLFAIAWAVLFGAASEMLGFSKEVGAFLAGVSLASTAFRDSIGARLTSLRDFLLLFFFIDLGARLDWSMVGSQLGESLVLSTFVLVGNPLIVLAIMGYMGYRRRTALLAGLTVAQISEFSLIVAALGLAIGHISEETMGLITLVGVVTISISTYMILYSGQLYRLLANPLRIFERSNPYREAARDTLEKSLPVDVVLVGLGNYGSGLVDYLLRRGKNLLGVDFDPVALDKWRKRGVPVVYGDMADPEMHEHLPLQKARWVVSTVRSREMNLALIHNLKKDGFSGKVALTATTGQEAAAFEDAGAHLVLRPFRDATEQAADALTYAMDFLPESIDWPLSFVEVRIKTDAVLAGKTIQDIPLSATGTSVLAISRGGRIFYEFEPDFRIYPADRLLIMGHPGGLKEAETILNQHALQCYTDDTDRFEIAGIPVADHSGIAGKSLADLHFRQRYGATLVGIRRGQEQITTINPDERLLAGDCLIVIGKAESVNALKNRAPL
ncbi:MULTISPECIES: cation:proton antiporter domain-containing protein [Syntrophotalea]|jgi:Kef-type K+ transport system membrane component KefB/Trk K+ transport system NAD-binding subunit|uniref:Sodium:proton exchanger n=1 Tax=Syntrophotalea acetylenica TaxID=29542 RepID=A0A1L3GFF9_SYNAC|nr:cation:proton antiporter [Syntrophotalea acetylenica]APG24683.1 sodium:proton exchanger [Syntrophotalea acetylenica]APG42735.1 sodium:proton exchanger [Syntrophotalea acetylenica]MDY0262154.1 cation:proton antiporter [Syntrophotalea acetylenica]